VNETEPSPARDCSGCRLGVDQIQLASPFGYRAADAAAFASLTSSCSASQYGYATPTPYALNSTVPPPMPTCSTSTYTVQNLEEDTCVSISGRHNVSTYNLIQENALMISCKDLRVGRTLCLPHTCTTHQREPYESCDFITSQYNITTAQFLAWNPNINPSCTNMVPLTGWYLCVR
jgi:hypothetical protein